MSPTVLLHAQPSIITLILDNGRSHMGFGPRVTSYLVQWWHYIPKDPVRRMSVLNVEVLQYVAYVVFRSGWSLQQVYNKSTPRV